LFLHKNSRTNDSLWTTEKKRRKKIAKGRKGKQSPEPIRNFLSSAKKYGLMIHSELQKIKKKRGKIGKKKMENSEI
jgi:hypothetical protein